jgi:hypothetical protein
MLTITGGCLAGSGEKIVAPTALGIHGTLIAQLEVHDWTGTRLICTATGFLTVN